MFDMFNPFGVIGKVVPNITGSDKDAIQEGMEKKDQNPLDEDTRNLIGQQYHVATLSNEDTAQRNLAGIDKTSGLIPSSAEMGRKRSALGMLPDQAMSDAIKRKADRSHQDQLNLMTARERFAAPLQKMQNQEKAFNILTKQRAIIKQVNDRNLNTILQKQAARAQAVTSIFGGAGMIVGGIFGGAAGAQAGGQIGGTAGGAVAGGA